MSSRQYEELSDRLRAQGWTVEARGLRWRAVPPDRGKPIVHFAASPERHAYRNTVADLRRSGFVVRPISPPPMPVDDALGDDPTKPSTYAPQELPMPAPSPATLDALFAALKDARVLSGMAADDLARTEEALEAARRTVADAETKRRAAADFLARANADLAKAREAFERGFSADGGS